MKFDLSDLFVAVLLSFCFGAMISLGFTSWNIVVGDKISIDGRVYQCEEVVENE